MAGRIIRAVELREFNFTEGADAGTPMIVAAQHIDVSWAREITMAVRWHDGAIGTGAKIDVGAIPDGFTMDDPTKNFVDITAPAGVVTFDNQGGGLAAPAYGTVVLGAGSTEAPGAMVAVYVFCTQATPAVTVDPRFSVDLVMRD